MSLKVIIAGGGSTYTPGILVGLIRKQKTFPIRELVLYDNDIDRVTKMGKFAQILLNDLYPGLKCTYSVDKEQSFFNADYVLCQIRTGGMKMREHDEKIPLRRGVIGQETCGPGGFSYGMRSITDMIELVNTVRKYSPSAWIVNYTNPAAIVALALAKKFPDDKRILNICDQPISLMLAYARLLNVAYEDLEPTYFGLNHFGWFTKIVHLPTQEDVTERIKNLILNEGFAPANKEERDPSWLVTYQAVKEMLELDPTYLPSTYLQYYLLPRETLKHLNPNHTRANEVMTNRETKVFAECDRIIQANDASISSAWAAAKNKNDGHGDMIVGIAESIYLDTDRKYIVIVKNDGIIPNVSSDMMVEVVSYLGKDGPKPIPYGEVSTYYKGLMENQHAYESLTVEAYFENSYLKALQALTLNRTVIDSKLAKEILDELIRVNEKFYPELI